MTDPDRAEDAPEIDIASALAAQQALFELDLAPSSQLDEAHREEAELIAYDRETMGPALMLGAIPVSLVILLLAGLLGEWVWALWPAAMGFLWLRLSWVRRWESDLPLTVPGFGTFQGSRKKKLIAAAAAAAALVILAERTGPATLDWAWAGFTGWAFPQGW